MSVRILAFITSIDTCSVALLNNGEIYTRCVIAQQQSYNCILTLINELLQITNCKLIDIDVIAISIGPGNFTGIRIGISVAQGLALGKSTKIICISTLQILAQGVLRHDKKARRVLASINARKDEVYWGEYQLDVNNSWCLTNETENVFSLNNAIKRMKLLNGNWITAGNSWKIYPFLYHGHGLCLDPYVITTPLAEDMLPLAKNLLYKDNFVKPENIQAVYLRNHIIQK
ncbi:tRNA (adenosine(37)-N6)-threonylcarbamoyltransferase complex dimerization subunit type 1 TsaB [Candidatus Pantoea edessiphila]|uniref:tRNA threonylcarbamoyladenosine biosynthesis protein TsaB n=1 Tax=Candidatus Pantoea edessiphila TaxID=2044610 RepID=A0A2P5SYM5_9GAMM|nr:tRNA (adenosine(37)-N6)-threonylcarbamoyltransferase complex dimerization subunit type 1 TsaB [Candidatus Pantoea edessiphila]MBK4775429.1 tRNA (adenosine(37)-N6)-threonylcarbamoyltransferase complex dimerization subunit type 1 TsaB [Pantoea sp. Edef]PPI87441.1 tRNA (adenosine(37)-N6)-threonylcarbamoyltransferase complex dimerization subunit type 1 TsaB [Candidatus Pantoea edessiphila]